MRFLSKWFGRGTTAEARADAAAFDDRPCPAFEAALARAFAAQVAAFAADHADEAFYGFAFHCNSDTRDILLCANTEDALTQTAKISARHRRQATLDECREALRWAPGDWVYQGFNLSTAQWEGQLEAALERIPAQDDPLGAERFLRCVCRALLQAEAAGAFAPLPRSGEFRVVCLDHDEDLAAGEARLAAVRSLLV